MWLECDNCEFYNVGDNCEECLKRHRPIREVSEDYFDVDYEPADLNNDECGDGYFNE